MHLLRSLVLGLLTAAATACPFCANLPGVETVQKLTDDHVAVLVVKTVDDGDGPGTLLEVETVIRKKAGTEIGKTVRIRRNMIAAKGRRYLLLAREPDLTRARIRPVTAQREEFLRAWADLSEDDDEASHQARLLFFARHFGHRDRLIGASVTQAFANAPYHRVKAVASRVPLDGLVACIDGKDQSRAHQGLVFLLIALNADRTAKHRFRAWMQDEDLRGQVGFDGLLGSYLLLHGEAGMKAVLELRPEPDAGRAQRRFFAFSLVTALDFHARYAKVLTRATIITTLRGLLDDPWTATRGIEALAAREDWAARDIVVRTDVQFGEKHPSVRAAARAFLEKCPE